MHIEFDASKNEANIRDCGLSFEQAANFDLGTAIVEQDTRKTYPEVRFVAVGFLGKRLPVMCFTPAAGGIHVISFRKVNTREVKDYDQTRTTD
ncbi:MAG: BrnT family toxin [Polaromonas sp.]|nr:BrnT family toxin [Polaromonas sp.]